MSRILAIVAHPDDEVIGCGATLAKLSDAGHEVRVLLPLRRNDPRGVAHWDDLVHAFREACGLLGAAPIIADHLVDECAVETDFYRLHDVVVREAEWADTIFTHWPGDANQVHRGLGRAVEAATRPFRRRREVYLFEVATSTEQGFFPSFSPNTYSLVSADQARRKCEAMAQYATEETAGRTPEALLRRMQMRGEEAGSSLAEAFYLAHHFI